MYGRCRCHRAQEGSYRLQTRIIKGVRRKAADFNDKDSAINLCLQCLHLGCDQVMYTQSVSKRVVQTSCDSVLVPPSQFNSGIRHICSSIVEI